MIGLLPRVGSLVKLMVKIDLVGFSSESGVLETYSHSGL